MKIREWIERETAGAGSQTDLDALVSAGLIARLRAEFPNADVCEIAYEWDARKMQIKRMT